MDPVFHLIVFAVLSLLLIFSIALGELIRKKRIPLIYKNLIVGGILKMCRIKSFIKKPEVIVLSLILIFRVVYFFCLDYNFTPDSYEYIAVNGFSWLQGSIDRYRLPVYPMIIDICKIISGEHFAFLVCSVQLLASLLSIVVLYLTIKRITDKKWICLFITFLYGTLEATTGWDKTLLTESLSLSLTVFIVFGIVSFVKTKTYKYVALTTICLLIGCFLRAIFVIFTGFFFGFLVLITILPAKKTDPITPKQRRVNAKCSVTAVIPIVLVFVYAFMFNAQYGGFTISDSALGQQLYIVIENGYYKDSSDKELQETADGIKNSIAESKLTNEIDSFVNNLFNKSHNKESIKKRLKTELPELGKDIILDPSIESELDNIIYNRNKNEYNCSYTSSTSLCRWFIMENYDRNRVKKFVNEAKLNHLKSYIIHIPLNTFESFSSYKCIKSSAIASLVSQITDNLLFFLNITVLHSLLVSLIELLSYIIILIKQKKADWIRLGLGVFILSTVLLSIFGTNGEFARTAITALPFMFVAFAVYVEWFFNRIINTLSDKSKR